MVQARTAAPIETEGGAGQGAPLGVLAQVGYVGLGQVVADGLVHRGLLGMAWRAVSSEDAADQHLANGVACAWQSPAKP